MHLYVGDSMLVVDNEQLEQFRFALAKCEAYYLVTARLYHGNVMVIELCNTPRSQESVYESLYSLLIQNPEDIIYEKQLLECLLGNKNFPVDD